MGMEWIKEHSSEILIGIGITGIGITGYFSAKGALKAEKLLEKKKPETIKEKAKFVVKSYGPAIASGVATAACFVGAHKIDIDKVAASATATAIAEATLGSYKKHIAEVITQDQAKEVDEKVANDLQSRNVVVPQGQTLFAATNDAVYKFVDDKFGVVFYTTFNDLNAARNDINNNLNHEEYVTLQDWYMTLNEYGAGIDIPVMAEDYGFRSSMGLIDYKPRPTIVNNKVEIHFEYTTEPITDYRDRY